MQTKQLHTVDIGYCDFSRDHIKKKVTISANCKKVIITVWFQAENQRSKWSQYPIMSKGDRFNVRYSLNLSTVLVLEFPNPVPVPVYER